MAMLSILGLYNYDDTIFDDMVIPEDDQGNPLLDSSQLIETILYQNAELELLYSEPSTMKKLIKLWSTGSQYAWKTLAKTLDLEYNPIWNKDGTITETESTSADSEGENIEQVSAYNETAFQNRSKSTGTSSGTGSRNFTRTEQGNIGVTSTQQLIREEREVAAFDIYDHISADFKNKFCLQVY